jgi:hypothetical protein
MPTVNVRVVDDIVTLWKETTWGAAIAAGQAFNRLDCAPAEASGFLVPHRAARSQQSRILDLGGVVHTSGLTTPKFSFKAPVKKAETAEWLYLATQNVVEGAGPGYIKSYSILPTQPDFQSSAGIVFAVAQRSIPSDGARCVLLRDCVASHVKFTCSPDENEGRLTVDTDWLARGPANRVYESTGTITEVAETYWHFLDLKACQKSITTPITLYPSSLEFDFALDIVPYSVDVGSGRYLTWVIKGYKVLLTVKVLWTQEAYDLLLLNDDDPLPNDIWRFTWGVSGSQWYMNHDFRCIILPESAQESTTPREITFKLEAGLDGSNAPYAGTLQDNTLRSWPT